MTLAINTNQVSYDKIRDTLISYIKNKPETQSWTSFLAGDAGTIVIELIATACTLLSHQAILSRRETYLNFAKNRSSAIAIAENLNYSTFKGKNPHVQLNVISNETISLKKWDVVGSVKDVDLIYMGNDIVLYGGVSTLIECAIGTLINDVFLEITTNTIDVFRFLNQGVSEDFRILFRKTSTSNYVEVELGSRILDLLDDKFVALTNPFDSIDLYYLNVKPNPLNLGDKVTLNSSVILPTNLIDSKPYYIIPVSENLVKFAETESDAFNGISISSDILSGLGIHLINNIYQFTAKEVLNTTTVTDIFEVKGIYPQYKYDTNSSLNLQYIKLQDISFDLTDIVFFYGLVDLSNTNTKILTTYKEPETISNIKVNAPLHSETQFILKAREDNPKNLKRLDSTFIDTAGRDVSTAVMELTYVRNDLTEITKEERLIYQKELMKTRNFGHQPTAIIDPIAVNYDLDITMKLYSNITLPNLFSVVKSVFAYELTNNDNVLLREKKLNYLFNLYQIEHELDHLINSNSEKYVQITRVNINKKLWSTNTKYKRGDFVIHNFVDKVFTVNFTNSNSEINLTNHGFYNNQKIYLKSSGTLPLGLLENTAYYVEVISSSVFKLHTAIPTNIGNLVTFSTNGSGVHTVFNNQSTQMFECVKLLGLNLIDFNVTHAVSQGMYVNSTANNLISGQAIKFTTLDNTTKLPVPLTENQIYYVEDTTDPNKFTIKQTPNSEIIYHSNSGQGTNAKIITGILVGNTSSIVSTTLLPLVSVTGLNVGDKIKFFTNNTLPSPLVENTIYYIKNITGLSIELSTLEDLSDDVIFNSIGNGVHTIHTGYGFSYSSLVSTSVNFDGFVKDDLILDNSILWKVYNLDDYLFQSNWNEYYLFNFNLITQ